MEPLRLKYGIYEGSGETAFGLICKDIADFFQRTLNITYGEFGDVTGEENDNFETNSTFRDGFDISFLPYSLNGGWYYTRYTYSLPLIYSDIVLVSGAPQKILETSFKGYYVFHKQVLVCLFFSLLMTSLTTTVLRSLLERKWLSGRRCRTKWKVLALMKELTNNIWNYFWSFFRIPIPTKGCYISSRVLMWCWLSMVLCVTTQLNASFTARISKMSYSSVDTLHDIKMPLFVSSQSFEHKTITFKASGDPMIGRLLREIESTGQYYSFLSLLDDEFLALINDSVINIITNTFLLRVMSHYNHEDGHWRLYVSPPIAPVIQGFLLSNNLSQSLKEDINLRIAWIFERKPYENVALECDRFSSLHQWRRDPNLNSDVSPLSLTDTLAGIFQYLISILLSLACILVEMFCTISRWLIFRPSKTKVKPLEPRRLKGRVRIELEIETDLDFNFKRVKQVAYDN